MAYTLDLKLAVYQPALITDGAQNVFDYALSVNVPDLSTTLQAKSAATDMLTGTAGAMTANCIVQPVTGEFSFPNPAAPVISPFTGLIFIYDNGPIIGFALTLLAQNSEAYLPFNMTMAFPASPVNVHSGAITFGDGWPGPFNMITTSFLAPG